MVTATEPASDARTTAPDRNLIVVGVDGSSSSLKAPRWSQYPTQPTNAALEVIAAWQVPPGWADGSWTDDYWSPKSIAQRNAQQAVQAVFGQPAANVSRRAVLGSPAELLIEVGRDAARIIVGRRDQQLGGPGDFGAEADIPGFIRACGRAFVPITIGHPR